MEVGKEEVCRGVPVKVEVEAVWDVLEPELELGVALVLVPVVLEGLRLL